MIVEFEMSVGGGSDVIVWADFDDGDLVEYTVSYLGVNVLDILSLDQVSRIETACYKAFREAVQAHADDVAFEQEVRHAHLCHTLRYGGEVI